MTTLHLLPSTGHQTASTLKQNALVLFDETQLLRRALQSLEMAWQGGGQEQFSSQADALLRSLQTQADALQFLAERLEREVTEWEETDRRGACGWESGQWSAAWLGRQASLPFSVRQGGAFWGSDAVLPLMTTVPLGGKEPLLLCSDGAAL